MDRKTALLLCGLPLLASSCLTEGGARIHRNTDTAAAREQAPPGRVPTVRASYGLNVLLPPRGEPYYFCPQQRLGVEKMQESVRHDYACFCRQSVYPHTVDTWVNEAALAAPGKRQVVIRLADQRGLFLVDGQPALDFPVCSGSASRPTPTGSFEVLEKDLNHHSNLYDNAPMHCFLRLTWDGVGMHIGPILGYPASHGCIRLPESAARKLYACATVGMPVQILP